MTEYLKSYLPALKSIIPQTSPTPSPLPEIGSKAPSLPDVTLEQKPTIVAFVRHCGCPFAEKEINILAEELKKNDELRIVIVQHAEKEQVNNWFNEIGGPRLFPDLSRYTLIPDPSREIYAKWGIGQLGWLGMISPSIITNLNNLKKSDNIDLRSTGAGSYRWQNSGGFAIDKERIIRWRKLAEDSSDICDYAEAVRSMI
ncbi:uncharacterized protein I206_100755 [Kwoniella pini CBS 10737]|uniref:Alkyl hydroperoxide reductase subunit C/ Thiol specific antioxidant domain-containing protein n=1 Tax=Kwoniella pini CBS 10737 TaxID=1296096 RepID=A0A1B9ICZ2_9TREE|nr:uncharacterized protein I206_00572 [Kwoniella pini CBS 10737]OCF53271.1 hypothetical protein I206_00572 [Kwoniella pini CBS 10737]